MNQKEVAALTDQELLEAVKKMKPTPIVDAFFIGFLVGIVIFSVVVNRWGFLTLIPVGLIYRVLKKPKRYEALRQGIEKTRVAIKLTRPVVHLWQILINSFFKSDFWRKFQTSNFY